MTCNLILVLRQSIYGHNILALGPFNLKAHMIKDKTNLNLSFPLLVAKYNFLKTLYKLKLPINSLFPVTLINVGFAVLKPLSRCLSLERIISAGRT